MQPGTLNNSGKAKKYLLKVLDVTDSAKTAHEKLSILFAQEGEITKAEYHLKKVKELTVKKVYSPN